VEELKEEGRLWPCLASAGDMDGCTVTQVFRFSAHGLI
jgi:hypothetical protein